jgi:hypothetical protein
MPRMLALRDLTYDYAQVKEGAEFNAGEQEARTLEIIGYATRRLKSPEALPDLSLNTGQVDELARCQIGPSDTGLSLPVEVREPGVKPKRGRPRGAKNKYSRRDLTAE